MANKREQQAERMSKTTTNESPSSQSLQAESVCENDDMLLEILVRLPDLRSAIRCCSVSKRWRSLIIQNPNFIRSSIRRNLAAVNDSASPRPYTFLFQYSVHQREFSKTRPRREYVSESHQLFSEESEIFHRIASPTTSRGANSSNLYLDFIPEKGEKAIKAQFDDLLLVSRAEVCRKYYICNPLTEKWFGLAEAPRLEGVAAIPHRAGLVCKQDMHRREFRVALFYSSGLNGSNLLKASVFSSETGKWSESAVREWDVLRRDEYYAGVHPWSNGGVVAARGGVLHYLTDLSPSKRCAIVAFNPFEEGKGGKKPWRFIDLPAELDALYVDDIWCFRPRSVNLHLGACRGRLRLARWPVGEYYSQPISRSAKKEALKVWELCHDDDDDGDGTVAAGTCAWRLVHEASVEGKGIRYVLGLHPDNGDVMFVYCKDDSVCEYNVVEHKLRRIGEFPAQLEDYPLFSPIRNPISVVPIVHSYNWPTPLPCISI